MAWKFAASVRYTRALTTSPGVMPPASRTARALSRTAVVWAVMSPDMTLLSLPLRESRPDVNSVSPARIP